ncbi:MAG: hypothetical protein KA457_11070 [Chitinophagales bacterium]|jgi:hypothetical protein|nr:hypothetical protein [Chitinophagales bacterium]
MKFAYLVLFSMIGCFGFAQELSTTHIDSVSLLPAETDTLKYEMKPNISVSETQAAEPKVAENALVNVKSKKKWKADIVHLLFGFNYSYYSPIMLEKDIFQNAYYPIKDSTPVWADRNTHTNLSKIYKTSTIQINLQANFWKGLYFGMNYQFTSIKKYKKDPNRGNLLSKNNAMFFIISGQFGYVFEFLKNKALQIQPSIRMGGYAADDYYDSGIGKKFYFGTDLQIRYLIKRKAGFSLGFDYDFLRYKQKGYNDIFEKNTYQKTTFNNFHLNAGLYINVSIDTKK